MLNSDSRYFRVMLANSLGYIDKCIQSEGKKSRRDIRGEKKIARVELEPSTNCMLMYTIMKLYSSLSTVGKYVDR